MGERDQGDFRRLGISGRNLFGAKACQAKRVGASESLVDPRSQNVLEELADLGMMSYVRDFLPKSFRDSVG